jgi:membrane complex biogenesis BtpA family protein
MDVFEGRPAVVGMVHLPPLPGAPEFDSRTAVRDRALADAEALVDGGVDAVLVENFGDAPFYPEDVPKHVVAEMTAATASVADAVDCPVGVNVLRNDAAAAVSVAAAAGASFVRVNVLAGARVTDQGLLEGQAHETMRLRDRVDADVAVLADVDVKHSAPLAERDLATTVADVVERGHADGVVVSGRATGAGVDFDHVAAVASLADEYGVPTVVGSGVTAETVADLLGAADGAIVGTAFKADGVTRNPVDPERVRRVVERVAGGDG